MFPWRVFWRPFRGVLGTLSLIHQVKLLQHASARPTGICLQSQFQTSHSKQRMQGDSFPFMKENWWQSFALCMQQTRCSRSCSTNTSVINSVINSVSAPLWKYLQTIITSKPLKLGTWNYDTMFTVPYVSCVACHMSRVTCDMSHVTCHVSHVKRRREKKVIKWWS